MTGATITIDIDDAPVQALFRKLLALGGDLSEPLEEIREAMLASHDERWDKEVDPDGNPWEPLSPAYKASKEKKRSGKGILVYDELLKLLASEVDNDELKIGTNRIYGATHQFGAPDRGIPARPFLGFSDDDQQEAAEILGEHISRLLQG